MVHNAWSARNVGRNLCGRLCNSAKQRQAELDIVTLARRCVFVLLKHVWCLCFYEADASANSKQLYLDTLALHSRSHGLLGIQV